MKKQYSKPEVEMIVFRYTDVMASSGEMPTIEYGVDEFESEISGDPQTFAMPLNTGNTVWINESEQEIEQES